MERKYPIPSRKALNESKDRFTALSSSSELIEILHKLAEHLE